MADNNNEKFEGFIDFGEDVSDIHEPLPVPTGSYDLVITDAKGIYAEKPDGGGKFLSKVQVLIDFPNEKNAATMFHNITLPVHGEDKKKFNFKVALVKKFYKLFNVPMGANGINTTDLVGAKCTSALVELSSYDKGDGTGPRESNRLNLNSIKV